MRHTRLILIAAALLLSACGAPQSTQQAAEPQASPAPQATSAPAPPTAAPTEGTFMNPSSAPAPAATPQPTAAPPATTAPQATVEPTARLILPAATSAPVAASPPATAAPQPTAAAQRATAASQPAAQRPTAPPAPAAAPAAAWRPSQPVRLVIADIGLDGRLASVGLDKDRAPIVPKHDIGWYNLSARPGAGENIVLWGHVLRFRDTPKVPAPFARLKELKPGAAVVLYDKDGGAHRYVVTQQLWVKPDQVEYILPRGKEMVTMVSCIGDKVIAGGEVVDMSNRLITIAEPAA
jgi:hypothetical protein